MQSKPLEFNIEEVSVLDINDLIDKNLRFKLVTEENGTNIQKVEEYLCRQC